MNATLVTPTFARDYERFVFLRESIERCGVEMPHLAVVDTESMPRFAGMPFRKNLTLVASEEILGSAMDRRRQVFGISRRDLRYWTSGKGVHGWMAQQLMKLAAARVMETEAMICLDSDTFFVSRVTGGDFFAADGRVHLYETTDDLDVEMAEWYAHSLRFLGQATLGVPPRRYTHAPVPMHVGVVREMQVHIEKIQGMNWMDAMVEAERITEYATYGAYARHVDQLRRTVPAAPRLTTYYWWPEQYETIAQDLEARVRGAGGVGAKMVLINSNGNRAVSDYRRHVERLWERQTVRHGQTAEVA